MPKKMNSSNISIIFNDKETFIIYDINETFSTFKLFLSKMMNLSFTEYDLYYLKTQMKITISQDLVQICDVIGSDTSPIFFIQKLPNKSLGNSKPTGTNMGTNTTWKLSVENFPSRLELYSLLHNYISEKGLDRNYKPNNKEKGIEFTFENKATAMSLKSYLDNLKSINPLYLKCFVLLEEDRNGVITPLENGSPDMRNKKIQMQLSEEKRDSLKGGKVATSGLGAGVGLTSTIDKSRIGNGSVGISNNKDQVSSDRFEREVLPKKQDRAKATNSLLTKRNELKSGKRSHLSKSINIHNKHDISKITIDDTRHIEVNKKTMQKYANHESPYLRGSTPYFTLEEKQRQQERLGKEKWIDKGGFNAVTGKMSSVKYFKYIENYVTRDPSKPPVVYQFREIHKDKWVGNKGFV